MLYYRTDIKASIILTESEETRVNGFQLRKEVTELLSIAYGTDGWVEENQSVSQENRKWQLCSNLQSDSGDTRQLSIVVYEPGSRQDREIQRDIQRNMIPATVAFDVNFHSDDGVGDDTDSLLDDFADIFGVRDEVYYPSPRRGWDDEFGYSHVGKSDPRVKNLGNSWMVEFKSVTSLVPADQAATALSAFYKNVVGTAAGKFANATSSANTLVFQSHGLSLRLSSSAPIPWDWVIRFARAMSQSAGLRWTVLYNAVAKNAYWDVATVLVVLSVVS